MMRIVYKDEEQFSLQAHPVRKLNKYMQQKNMGKGKII